MESTTAVNLALALVAEGAKVGIPDADIYGPSIPWQYAGTEHERPTSPDLSTYGTNHGARPGDQLYRLSGDRTTMLWWRGPMASKALMQLLQDTLWPDLDYLVLDMPPAYGDIQPMLSQNIPDRALVVITLQ